MKERAEQRLDGTDPDEVVPGWYQRTWDDDSYAFFDVPADGTP